MISLVIPTLNEAGVISTLMMQLRRQSLKDMEIIIADGGSADDTVALAKDLGAKVVLSEPGRGKQLNAGARAATGSILLFLHADSSLTSDTQIADALARFCEEKDEVAGHFPLSFAGDKKTVSRLRFFEEKTRLNRPGTFNGDQGLLIRAETFFDLNGFWERLPILEDQEFAERYQRTGRFITLPAVIKTSARRFQDEGIKERITLNTLIMGMFHLRLNTFFTRAPDVYRTAAEGSRLNLAPFFDLARKSVMASGLKEGIRRCYRIGRYTNQNFWQVFLWLGINTASPQSDEKQKWLSGYDRYVAPLTNNVIGHLIATVFVVGWFFGTRLRLALR